MGINPALLDMARSNVIKMKKQAFVAAGDPAMGGAPPMDPAMAGGAPPMDPAMAGGAPPMDPAMAGGAPPMDPAMAGGAPPMDPMAQLQPMIAQAVQTAMASQGGGAGGGAGPAIKPKIDINVEIMQLKKLVAKLCDAMGVQIPAAEMVATPEDLGQMAEGGTGAPAMADQSAGGALGSIGGIEPMKAAEWEHGEAFSPPAGYEFNEAINQNRSNANLAAAMLLKMRA